MIKRGRGNTGMRKCDAAILTVNRVIKRNASPLTRSLHMNLPEKIELARGASPGQSESAGKPDALQTLTRICSSACLVAKRLECVRLAGAFLPHAAPDKSPRFIRSKRELIRGILYRAKTPSTHGCIGVTIS